MQWSPNLVTNKFSFLQETTLNVWSGKYTSLLVFFWTKLVSWWIFATIVMHSWMGECAHRRGEKKQKQQQEKKKRRKKEQNNQPTDSYLPICSLKLVENESKSHCTTIMIMMSHYILRCKYGLKETEKKTYVQNDDWCVNSCDTMVFAFQRCAPLFHCRVIMFNIWIWKWHHIHRSDNRILLS